MSEECLMRLVSFGGVVGGWASRSSKRRPAAIVPDNESGLRLIITIRGRTSPAGRPWD